MIPDGLERCGACGELRGEFMYNDGWGEARTPVICICAGIPCPGCGRNNIRRPISNYYDERDGRVWHTPYFGCAFRCRVCRKAAVAAGQAERSPQR